MKLYFIFLFCLLSVTVDAQSAPDLDEIKKATTDPSSQLYYPTLLNRFLNDPNSISAADARFLYYGKLYSAGYKPYNFHPDEMKFHEQMSSGKYAKAIITGEQILSNDPLNAEFLSKLSFCYEKVKDTTKAKDYAAKTVLLVNVIMESGNGTSRETAYRVTGVPDEYVLFNIMEIKPLNRRSDGAGTGHVFDVWRVKQKKEKRDLYFEVLVNMDAYKD